MLINQCPDPLYQCNHTSCCILQEMHTWKYSAIEFLYLNWRSSSLWARTINRSVYMQASYHSAFFPRHTLMLFYSVPFYHSVSFCFLRSIFPSFLNVFGYRKKFMNERPKIWLNRLLMDIIRPSSRMDQQVNDSHDFHLMHKCNDCHSAWKCASFGNP